MGAYADTVDRALALFSPRNITEWSGVSRLISGRAGFPDGKYFTYANEGYAKNALVFACIEELSTSAAEPVMHAQQADKWYHWTDESTNQAARLMRIMNRPNRFMDGYEFWATVILHRSIAGNAYALKVRSASGRVVELWLLRPDRIRIVPSATDFIERYEYVIDAQTIPIPVNDIIQWKTRNPVDEFFGMPPMFPIAGNIDLDNYARDFVKTYFEKAGVPSGILTTKSRMAEDLKKELREKFARDYGNGQWHGTLVLDGADASYTAMTQSLGAQGLVLPELNTISESRICMAFGIDPGMIGTIIGAENSSYANRKAMRESFWNETLKPLYRELQGPLNRALVPEFPGVTQMGFDLSTVGALQPDQDAVHTRVRADVAVGIVGQREGRRLLGYDEPDTDDVFFIPSTLTQTPTADIGKLPEPAPATSVPAGV